MSLLSNKMMSRRSLLRAFGATSAGLALAACQPKVVEVEKEVTKVVQEVVKETVMVEGTPQVVEKEVTRVVEATKAPVSVVEVIEWGKDTTVPGGNKAMIEAFNAQSENIQIKAESVPSVAGQSAGQMQKILTAIAAGTVPDFFYLDRFLGTEFAGRKAILPLDEYINAGSISGYEFVPACWGEGTFEGQQFNIPASEGNIGYWSLAYNRDIMADAGLDPDKPPTTWAELQDAAIKMTEPEGNSFRRIGLVPLYGASWFYQWCWSNDGFLITDDDTKVTLTDPKNVEALEYLVQLYDKLGGAEKINAFSAGFQGAADDPFLTGLLGMVMYGEYQLPTTAKYKPDLKLGVTFFPKPRPEAPTTTWVGGWSWALPRGSKHPKEAFTAIEWLARENGLMAYQAGQAAEAEKEGGVWIPLIAAHLKTNDLGRNVYYEKLKEKAPYVAEGYDFYYEAPKAYDRMFYRPKTLIASLLWEAQATAVQEACYGQKTALEALQGWEERCQTALDEAIAKTS
jgi:multiple sugar transport system permease protein